MASTQLALFENHSIRRIQVGGVVHFSVIDVIDAVMRQPLPGLAVDDPLGGFRVNHVVYPLVIVAYSFRKPPRHDLTRRNARYVDAIRR